jgi:signal transduction histidine kinase
LAARYLRALRRQLRRPGGGKSPPARNLGRSAVASGLATLDLARIHDHAVQVLRASSDAKDWYHGAAKRAARFFADALVPLEAHRRAIRENNQHLQQRNEALRRHTAALARSNRRLQRESARRQAGELKLQQSKERYRTLFIESQVMQGKLRQLTRQILSAQEDERKKISRELHDEVVQTLVGITVSLSALGAGVEGGARTLQRQIARTQRLVQHSVSAVHRFARELRPAVLDDLGLIPALHAYSQELAARKKIRIQLVAFGGVEQLSSARRTVLFRVAQEALNNVARHAEATQALLRITEQGETIHMDVSDNGRSFPVAKTLIARNNKRLGLIGMKERIEMIGGTFAIESVPGTGTTIHTSIPFLREAIPS